MPPDDFAEIAPIIAIADDAALLAGAWKDEAIAALAGFGAALLRGAITTEDAAERALDRICGELLEDAFWSTPRSKVSGKTLTATEYPQARTIQLHSEMAYMRSWPRFVSFHALEVAADGGQTTVCDIDRVSEQLAARLAVYAARGVTYRRTFQKGVDIAWQHAFQTQDRADFERIAESSGMTLEWLSDDALATSHTAQGAIAAEDGRPLFFNQAHMFHASLLDPELRQAIEARYGPGRLPRHATFGDGSPIPRSDITAIADAFERHRSEMRWRRGDVLILDNLRFAHGRLPFTGSRRVHVALARQENMPVRVALT